jgi:hypothetical protein
MGESAAAMRAGTSVDRVADTAIWAVHAMGTPGSGSRIACPRRVGRAPAAAFESDSRLLCVAMQQGRAAGWTAHQGRIRIEVFDFANGIALVAGVDVAGHSSSRTRPSGRRFSVSGSVLSRTIGRGVAAISTGSIGLDLLSKTAWI